MTTRATVKCLQKVLFPSRRNYSSNTNMDLKLVVKRLQQYADLRIATSGSFKDNVGLLVEPSDTLTVSRVLVTNDLTEPVLAEAIQKKVNLIVSYHPAIFKPLKKLTQSEWKERSLIKCIEQRIAVYSPHTSWDSIDGGINDWILEGFETKRVENVEGITAFEQPTGFSKSIRIILDNKEAKNKLLSQVATLSNVKFLSEKEISENRVDVEFIGSDQGVIRMIDLIKINYDSSALQTLRLTDLQKPLLKNVGLGRLGYLTEPQTIRRVVELLKAQLKLKHFQIALGNGKQLEDTVSVLAVGAGSGSSILNNTNADIIITGEFSHHEILHETHRGKTVICTNHSNTERGYFEAFKTRFDALLKKNNESLEILISETDRDPLEFI